MNIDLDWDERNLIIDLLNEHIKGITRGEIIYGDRAENEGVLVVAENLLGKVND